MSKTESLKLKAKSYKRILIVRMDRIGDVLLSTPAIKAVRDSYPDSYIAFMVRPYAREIVEGNSYLNEVIVYDKDFAQRGLFDNIRFIKMLRRKHFDLAIILHPTTRTHLLVFLAGIPVRVGYDFKWGFLLTRKVPHTKQFGLKHEIDYSLDLLKYAGIEAAGKTLYMPIKEDAEKNIASIFSDNKINNGDTVIVINPGASCPSKRWSAERFAKVAKRLTEKYSAKIILISDPKDKVFCDKITSILDGKCLNLAGKTSVGDVASILKRAKLFISNDSGPVHIACAVGTPVIAIFGRSDRGLSPKRWGPTGRRDIILHKDVGCATCLAHNCKTGFRCLDAVTADEVIAAADELLARI